MEVWISHGKLDGRSGMSLFLWKGRVDIIEIGWIDGRICHCSIRYLSSERFLGNVQRL
jgi:hypothetical protein